MKEFILWSHTQEAYIARVLNIDNRGFLVTTSDPAEAMHFSSPADAEAYSARILHVFRIKETRSWEVQIDPDMYDC